jgi:hypothetical protein
MEPTYNLLRTDDDRVKNVEKEVHRVLKKLMWTTCFQTFLVGVGFTFGYNFSLWLNR